MHNKLLCWQDEKLFLLEMSMLTHFWLSSDLLECKIMPSSLTLCHSWHGIVFTNWPISGLFLLFSNNFTEQKV